MRPKIYSESITTNSQYGRHVITVVGIFTKEKTMVNGKKSIKRVLSYGYSICHPDDAHDAEFGLKMATRRAQTDPMGKMETSFTTCLNVDQIKLMLKGEAEYIAQHIEKFITKFRK